MVIPVRFRDSQQGFMDRGALSRLGIFVVLTFTQPLAGTKEQSRFSITINTFSSIRKALAVSDDNRGAAARPQRLLIASSITMAPKAVVVPALVALMLITGVCNTILTKYQVCLIPTPGAIHY